MNSPTNLTQRIPQRLVFFLGKGGVGRTTLATSFAQLCALNGEKTLIVQWALHDSVSLLFSKPAAGHDSEPIAPNLWTMNFSPDEAIREYFIDHLKLKLLYNLVIENRHVQRLIHAAPGVQELFFLGRLFWLVCLSEEIRGTRFDRVIVDTQATGHGVSLFTVAPTIAQFGMTGPLASECERVAKMLADPKLVGTALVTLPEELPVEETLEFLPRLTKDLGRSPAALFINRSLSPFMEKNHASLDERHVLGIWKDNLSSEQAVNALGLLHRDLCKRVHFEDVLRQSTAKIAAEVPLIPVPDIGLANPDAAASAVLEGVTQWLGNTNQNPGDSDPRTHHASTADVLAAEISEDQR
ncbi:MAG: ArsA family ATPase [Silvanigrellaceae bacterium]